MDALQFLSEMFELLGEDITQTRISNRNYGGELNFNHEWKRSKAELGRGVFAKVTADKKDPHMVNKRTIQPMGPEHRVKADGFNQYVRMLKANDVMDNIHFPKVYKATTSTDKTGTHRDSYTIEVLEKLSSISKEEFEALAERCFFRPVYDADALAERVSEACESAYGRKSYIKMETLLEACEIVERFSHESDFQLDLHEGNLMVRRTPMGLQLVISDPFGFLKHSAKHKYSPQPIQ